MKARLLAKLSLWLEDPNPILLKELRATFRTALFARFLYISVGLTSLFVLSAGAIMASGDVPPATVGQGLFQFFLGLTLFLISLIAPGFAATAITSEREQRTWESLLLSGMSASRIVNGKFLAAYASIALVIVSLAPVSGIGFLFGGVAPTQVVVGLLSMLVALAPAIAFGLAVSARFQSTRLSIVIATVFFLPTTFVGTLVMAAFGSVAHDQWHLPMEGPFFYTDAFATRPGEWDTWVLLLGGTAYAVGLPVWFLLASAVAGVRPAAENRSAPLKQWAMVNTLATAVVAFGFEMLSSSARDQAKLGLFGLCMVGCLTGFYALLFANEPPLPPRPYELALKNGPAWRRILGFFGPGAAGTLRFSALLIVVTSALSVAVVVGVRHLTHPSWNQHVEWDLASLVIAVGLAFVSLFAAAFGTWMRLVLRNGLAARVITASVIAGAAVAPFMLALAFDTHSVDRLDREAPLVVHFSAIYPAILAAELNDMGWLEALGNVFRISVTVVTYGLLALACWATVEARVRTARRMTERRRAQLAGPAHETPPAAPSDAASSESTPEPAG